MATESPLPLEVQRAEPAVWMSRLLILESLDPWIEIRNIPLHRGLNIVWSVDVDRNDETAPVMTGHGVGKTTFCRLMRYCLGEGTFGHKLLVQRIRKQLAEAYVGAEVRVAGEKWAVARPLGRSHVSYAQRDVTIEQLLTNRPSARSYHEFTDVLAAATLKDFPANVTLSGNRPIEWRHVLAWCARDQEARYQNFWDWRSPRSDHDTPAFNKPRQDAMFLVRAALGLVANKELRLQRRLLEIDERLKKLDESIAARQREPVFQVHRIRDELVREYGIEGAADAPIDKSELFSLPALVTKRQTDLATEQTDLDAQLAELNRQLLTLQVRIQDSEQVANEWQATTETTQAGSETLTRSVQQRQADREKLDQIKDDWCRYGGVTFGDCQHVQDRAAHLDSLIPIEDVQTTMVVARRDQESSETRDRADRATQRARELATERDSLLKTKNDLEKQRAGLASKSEQLPLKLSSLTKWYAYFTDNSSDPDLDDLIRERTSLLSEQETKKGNLVQSLTEQGQRLGALQRVFGSLVSRVLSPEFLGTARIHDGEIECSITHGSVLAGEAVETLAVLLTDLTCLLLGAEQNCRHPGLHIHDSPREADLGARIYQRFLASIAEIHQQLGGQDSAPFQYIVTTTTAPPTALRTREFLAESLSNEHVNELLFRRSLGEPAPTAAPSDQRSLLDGLE